MDNAVEDRIKKINRMLDSLERIEARIDELNTLLFKGGYTAAEFHQLVSERSGLIRCRDVLEKNAKDTYRVKLEREHGSININGMVEL